MDGTAPLMVPVGTPRRVFIVAGVLAGVGLGVCSLAGHPLYGVLFVVGLMLGALNNIMTLRTVLRHVAHEDLDRRRFAVASLGRLGYVTLIAAVFLVVFRIAGVAVVIGLALFQLIAVIGTTIPVVKEFWKV